MDAPVSASSAVLRGATTIILGTVPCGPSAQSPSFELPGIQKPRINRTLVAVFHRLMHKVRMRLLLAALVAASSVASAQECPQGPADSLANAGLGASVAHWPFTPAILESAARAVFNDFGYALVQPEDRAQPFITRPSRRRPNHPLLVSFPADEHPGVVLSLDCRFRPAEVDGVPVRARTVMPIMFRLAP